MDFIYINGYLTVQGDYGNITYSCFNRNNTSEEIAGFESNIGSIPAQYICDTVKFLADFHINLKAHSQYHIFNLGIYVIAQSFILLTSFQVLSNHLVHITADKIISGLYVKDEYNLVLVSSLE
jgi:hypothetical protein